MNAGQVLACALLAVLAGCGAATAQWVDAQGEPAADQDMRACRSIAGASGDRYGRSGGSLYTPGSIQDQMMGDTRYGEEERERQRAYIQCMRKLGYRPRS